MSYSKHSENPAKGDREYNRLVPTILDETAVRVLSDVDGNLIKFDSSDAAPNYIGLNQSMTALDESDDWVILKFTYSGSAVTQIQRAKGSWTGRVALF
jgi:prophage tail gpP-like protein